MSDTKFTPGPWKVFKTTDGKILGIGGEDAGGVTDSRFSLWRGGDEKEANAHLIAASPDLYAALEAVIDRFDSDFTGHSMDALVIEDCKLAISQAKAPSPNKGGA